MQPIKQHLMGIMASSLALIMMLSSVIFIAEPMTSFAQTNDDDAWREAAELPTPRSEFDAVEMDSKIYVIGGFGEHRGDQETARNLIVYDPETDNWEQIARIPDGGRHHLMMAGYEGKLYVFGGTHFIPSRENNSLQPYAYNLEAGEWEELAEMPSRRTGGKAVVLDEYIYIVGGTGVRNRDMHLLRYDPANDEWSELAVPNTARDHVAAVALDGKIYALGGRETGFEDYQSIEIYDPETDTWSEGPEMNEARAGFGAAVVDGRIYVAGGELLAGGERGVVETMERFNPETAEWEIVTETPIALHGMPLVALDDELYVIGGSTVAAAAENVAQVFIYTPETTAD